MTPLQHEALDRTHCVLVMVDEILMSHEYICSDPILLDKVGEVQQALADMYQMIGARR